MAGYDINVGRDLLPGVAAGAKALKYAAIEFWRETPEFAILNGGGT